MKSLYRIWFLLFFVACGSTIARSQGTPVSALEELVSSEKITDALRHYPVAVEQEIQGLPESERAEAAEHLVPRQKLATLGYELRKASQPGQWQVFDASGNGRMTFTVLNSFISGVDAMVLLRGDFNARGDGEFSGPASSMNFVFLRFEEGEWRLKSLGDWRVERDFESDEFAQGLTPAGRNEQAAVATLEQLSNALREYRRAYSATGFPANLAALSGPIPEEVDKPSAPPQEDKPEGNETESNSDASELEEPALSATPEYAHLLEPGFMASPLIREGYVFHYKLLDPGAGQENGGAFQITATPLQFGRTGSKGYFIDQTSVVRFTLDNRDANENDQVLNSRTGSQLSTHDVRRELHGATF